MLTHNKKVVKIFFFDAVFSPLFILTSRWYIIDKYFTHNLT